MHARRTARAGIVATLVAAIVTGTTGGAIAAPTHDQQIENTMRSIIRAADRTGDVTIESLTETINTRNGKNAWERNVDFSVTDGHSGEFGKFSLAISEDGTIGIATRSADGGCTLTTYKDGIITSWSIADVGKSCTGDSALRGPDEAIEWVDPVPPGEPTDLVAVPGDTTVTLTWTAPADTDLKMYDIIVDGTVVATVPAGTTTYTVPHLTNYVEYTFEVTAIDLAENASARSAPVKATPVDLTPPTAIVNLTGTASDRQVQLAWTHPDPSDVAEYRIYQNGVMVQSTPTPGATIAGLTNGTTYTYTVTTVDRHGNESTHSNPVTLTPNVPTNETGTGGAGGPAEIGWAATWNIGPTLFTSMGWHTSVADHKGGIYVLGGMNTTTSGPQSAGYYMTPITNAWNRIPAAPAARSAHASGIDAQGRVYLISGMTTPSIGATAATSWRYDPTTKAWSSIAPLPQALSYTGYTSDAEGRIYVLGGRRTTSTTSGVAVADMYRYTPETDTWESLPNLPQAVWGSSVTTDGKGGIYLAGGWTAQGVATSNVYRYDIATSTWTRLTSMPVAKVNAATSYDTKGRLYVIGGAASGSRDSQTSVHRYDPATRLWSSLSPLPIGVWGASAVSTKSGIFNIGGWRSRAAAYTNAVAIYRG